MSFRFEDLDDRQAEDAQTGFAADGRAPQPAANVRPSPGYLLVALGVLVVSALLWLFDGQLYRLLGYLATGIVAITSLALYKVRRDAATAHRNYSHSTGADTIAVGLLIAAVVLALLHTIPFAIEVARPS